MDSIKNLYRLVNEIPNKAKDISILKADVKILDTLFIGDSKKIEKLSRETIDELKEEYGISIDMSDVEFSYLTSCRFKWKRPEKETEGYLEGGFIFNGLTDIFANNLQFWEKSIDEFVEFENKNLIDFNLIKELRWIESPVIPTEAEYCPQFGCVKLEKGKLPKEFFFYDSGIVYPLPFKTLNEYINGLTASGFVNCWQYFYIDPQIIIPKNKGIKYLTWSKHTSSRLVGEFASNNNEDVIKHDRLDLINEYLQRCIRLLPASFPFMNFEHHERYYVRFKKLYEK